MLVCGVLGGEASDHYRNVVIFRPGWLWRRWSAGAVGFEVL
jgi:hypothetical protein